MTFQGWPEEALDFYEGLEADNSKSYWTAHKAVYEEKVLGPMTELADELSPEFGATKIFRPYRDLRFSKDRSPYATAISAVVGDGYIRLSAQGLAAGSGMYQMASDQLDRYRRAVAADVAGEDLAGRIAVIEKSGAAVHGHETLKKAPRGYPADHPRIDLLRCKGLIVWRDWPVAPWLATAAAKEHIADFLATVRPLNDWLSSHVGPSRIEPARR
jgi:uncharacterized protein (TIGR02453 family)